MDKGFNPLKQDMHNAIAMECVLFTMGKNSLWSTNTG